MSRNDANDYAQRLYARVPAYYRVLDEEQGMPLYALLATVGEQVANIRADLDALWDDFFIETCEDWVVPYLAGLTGTHLLANPVGQSNRLDVRNTVMWRRSKGTPAMLRALAQSISGWPTDLAEFFQVLGWSQNMNHLRLHSKLTPDLRDTHALSLLGAAADPFSHAADFKTARALSQARVVPESLGIGRAAWATPGRYQIKNLGFFERRLQTFAINGATPAAVKPGLATPANAACYTFDPLFRDTPLFVKDSGEALTRAAFAHAPWETFGTDVAVRQFGVLLASNAEPLPPLSNSQTPFSFGGAGAGLQLHATAGLRLMPSAPLQTGDPHFVITAGWFNAGTITTLGSLSTLHAALNDNDVFHSGVATPGRGRLVIQIQTGRASLGWPGMSTSPAGRFPGAVIAVRAARTGAVHQEDGIYVYLPSTYLTPGDVLTLHVSDDGSTYRKNDFSLTSLERDSEGSVFPARALTSSTRPASGFTTLNRRRGALRLPDPARFGNARIYFQVEIFSGAFAPLAGIATAARPSNPTGFSGPTPWPEFTSRPSIGASNNTVANEGLLAVLVQPLQGNFIPASELVVSNRSGESLLVYLPEITNAPSDGVRFFVADDGSTFFAPPEPDLVNVSIGPDATLAGLELSRESAGQVLPIPGRWPLQHRRPTAINLCRCERRTLLQSDELGIDPELGRFALAVNDPILTAALPGDAPFSSHALTVDYVEAFSGRVGARTFDRGLDTAAPPTILVSQSGDAASLSAPDIPNNRLHSTLASALAVATNNDVIEIADSATYLAPAEIIFQNPVVRNLTIRAAAGQRPCLSFYTGAGAPAAGSLRIRSPLDSLEINGLLISGGPVEIESNVKQFNLLGCTLDPRSATAGWSLRASDSDLNHQAVYLVCRSITGGLRIGAGVDRLIVADSIVDQQGSVAIGELPFIVCPPALASVVSPPVSVTSTPTTSNVLQLERVTVLGRIECDVLQASECLLNDLAVVDDQQSGCIRFSRWERGSILPRRFQCIPTEAQARETPPNRRCLPAQFNSLRFGRPDYAQLGAMRQPEILSASESGAEVGAFASELNQIRLANLLVKLREFMPVSLTAVVVAET